MQLSDDEDEDEDEEAGAKYSAGNFMAQNESLREAHHTFCAPRTLKRSAPYPEYSPSR
jgi:hypothetical protein